MNTKFAFLRKFAEYVNYKQCSLFDTFSVNGILSHSFEVRSIHTGANIEYVHIDFCVQLLDIKSLLLIQLYIVNWEDIP